MPGVVSREREGRGSDTGDAEEQEYRTSANAAVWEAAMRMVRYAANYLPVSHGRRDESTVAAAGGGWRRSKKGEMRWALASVDEKQPFELVGIWIDELWKHVRQDLERRLNYDKLEVLVSDGGPGREENLFRSGMRCQRCVWHAKRDFPYILYADQVKKSQQGPLKQTLDSIELMKVTKVKLEQLGSAEHVSLLANKTREGCSQLLEVLPEDRYPHARRYIQNLSSQVATFFDFWLEHTVWIPMTTNKLENAFSQVKNRICAVGKRWSERGLMNWLKVVVYKVFYPQSWDNIWEKYLGLDPALRITITGVSYQWI